MTTVGNTHKDQIHVDANRAILEKHALRAANYKSEMKRLVAVPSPNGGYRMTLIRYG